MGCVGGRWPRRRMAEVEERMGQEKSVCSQGQGGQEAPLTLTEPPLRTLLECPYTQSVIKMSVCIYLVHRHLKMYP